jgi:hypothetical protein
MKEAELMSEELDVLLAKLKRVFVAIVSAYH